MFLYDAQVESFIPVTSAEIDANGEFTFKYLDVGTYKLGLEFETGYPKQYFGGTNDKSKATIIEVIAGETSDVGIAIEAESILDLTFVDSQTEEEIDSTRLYINLYDEHGEVLYRSNGSQFSTVDGKVTISGLMAGNYHLWVFDENRGYTAGYHAVNAHDKTQTPPINVSAFETKSMTIELTPSAKMQGKVIGSNNDPVSRATLDLYLVDSQCGHRHRVTDGYLDANGTFEFDLLVPGAEYEVEVNPWNDSEYSTFKLSNIIVDAGEIETFDIDLTTGGKIDVTLLDGDTNEEIGGYVQIYRKLADTVRPYFFQQIGFMTIIPGQEVESPYLQTGEYYFSVYSGEDYDPLSFDRESPIPFQIKDGETSSISFSLNKSSSATISGGVEGYVFTADKGEGLQYVYINAYQLVDGELALMGSGESERSEAPLGKYRIDGLADGEYYIEFKPEQRAIYDFESEHYRSTWLGGVQHYQESQTVIVANGEIASGISLGLEPGGSIKAELKQPAFQSLFNSANAVSLFDQDGNLVRESINLFYDHDFLGLWPGDYYVLFNDYRFTTEMGCNPKIYYGEWHDESSTFEDATPITILGTETSEIVGNLSLNNLPPELPDESMKSFSITGRVVDESNNPIAGVTVTAENGRGASNTAITDTNGEYSLNLPNGSYTITFEKEGYDFSGVSFEVTLDGGDQVIEDVVVPDEPDLTPTPVTPTPVTPTPVTPTPVTPTPEPPAENDHTIYLPYVVH